MSVWNDIKFSYALQGRKKYSVIKSFCFYYSNILLFTDYMLEQLKNDGLENVHAEEAMVGLRT